MHRVLLRRLTVVFFLAFMAVAPIQAAPKGGDSSAGFFERAITKIVQIVKRIIPLEDAQPTFPHP